jgi:hypothetical protein
MHTLRSPRTAAIAAVLAVGLALGACSDRENEKTSNPGAGPQAPGVTQGTNPAEAAKTAPATQP